MAGTTTAAETVGSGSVKTGILKTLEVLLYLGAFAILFLAPWFDAYTMSYYRGSLTLIYKYELLRLVWMPVVASVCFIVTLKGIFEKDANTLKYRIVKTALPGFCLALTVGVQLTLFKTRILDNSAWGFGLFAAIFAVLLVINFAGPVNLSYRESRYYRFQALFCYLFSLPGALVTLFCNNDDELLLRHAVQSVLCGAAAIAVWFNARELAGGIPVGLLAVSCLALVLPRFTLIDKKGIGRLFKWVQPRYIDIVNLVGGMLCLVGSFFILDSVFAFTRYEAISTPGMTNPFRYDMTRNIVFFVLYTGVGLFLIWDNSRQTPDEAVV